MLFTMNIPLKITRKTLKKIIIGLGAFLVLYALARHFTDFDPGDIWDKRVTDGIIIAALALFFYNRKLIRDEKLAEQKAEEEAQRSSEEETEEADDSQDDENLPHWERNKNGED